MYKEYHNLRKWGSGAENPRDMDTFMQHVTSKEKEIEKLRQDLEKFVVCLQTLAIVSLDKF